MPLAASAVRLIGRSMIRSARETGAPETKGRSSLRKKHQNGSLKKVSEVWIGRGGGLVEANSPRSWSRSSGPRDKRGLGEVVEGCTCLSIGESGNDDRDHQPGSDRLSPTAKFGRRSSGSLNRNQLQNFLDRKGELQRRGLEQDLKSDDAKLLIFLERETGDLPPKYPPNVTEKSA